MRVVWPGRMIPADCHLTSCRGPVLGGTKRFSQSTRCSGLQSSELGLANGGPFGLTIAATGAVPGLAFFATGLAIIANGSQMVVTGSRSSQPNAGSSSW